VLGGIGLADLSSGTWQQSDSPLALSGRSRVRPGATTGTNQYSFLTFVHGRNEIMKFGIGLPAHGGWLAAKGFETSLSALLSLELAAIAEGCRYSCIYASENFLNGSHDTDSDVGDTACFSDAVMGPLTNSCMDRKFGKELPLG
jgi:hypothetical protein